MTRKACEGAPTIIGETRGLEYCQECGDGVAWDCVDDPEMGFKSCPRAYKTMEYLYRRRRYYLHGKWVSWYEKCPVISTTALCYVVESETFPGTPLHPGGRFHVSRPQIQRQGWAYHSRHGECFYVIPKDDGCPFPSPEVLQSLKQEVRIGQ